MSKPTLLTLPRELRFEIFTLLTPSSPISYPYKHSPIASISHQPPPSALQRTCYFLHSEITAFFYATATLRFVVQAFKPVYNDAHYAACLHAVRQARRVEVVLIWSTDAQHAELHGEPWSVQFRTSLQRTVELLVEEAKCLEVLVVSVRDASDEQEAWDIKDGIVAPLRDMAGKVRMVAGEVMAGDEQEHGWREWLDSQLNNIDICTSTH
jgi:hypothetical protein